MKNEKEEKKESKKTLGDLLKAVEIIPLRDFPSGIHQNEIHIDNIKEGVPVIIPQKFLQNMVTEKVIDKIPRG